MTMIVNMKKVCFILVSGVRSNPLIRHNTKPKFGKTLRAPAVWAWGSDEYFGRCRSLSLLCTWVNSQLHIVC